jgi:hypothetical protein
MKGLRIVNKCNYITLTKKNEGNEKCKENIRITMFVVSEIKWKNDANKMLGTENKIWWSGEEEKRN